MSEKGAGGQGAGAKSPKRESMCRRVQLRIRSRGRQNKIDGPPRTFAKSHTHPPTRTFFSLTFFQYVFGRFSARGVQKHHKNYFCKKSMSKAFPKISTKISMSGFPRIFLFYRVFGCFIAFSKALQKMFCNVSKSFYKTFDQKSKTDFFSIFLITFLGVSR
jgi:hypothetical protein